MVRHSNHPARPAPPAAPAAPPQWQPLNWSFPFAPAHGNPADPHTWLRALASGDGGFYPLGANGMFHGGIHFDAGTGSALTQGNGVQAIADGEVVAYRLDAVYPELTYPTTPPRYALYSTGFVLIRHRLVLPPAPDAPGTSLAAGSSASSASATATSGPQEYQLPADEVLEFYSLYMHQLDWAGYQAAQRDGGSQSVSSVHPLPFWKGDRHFRVGGKAADRQAQAPQRNTPFRFDLSTADTDAAELNDETWPASAAAVPSFDGLYALAPYADSKVRYTPPQSSATDDKDSAQSAQGIRIFDRANGKVIGLLPRGCELGVVGDGAKGWAQIARVIKGAPVAGMVGGTPDPHASTGWVNLDLLDVVIDPKPPDAVVVLDKPYPVKAGDVVGYLGEYQSSTQSQVMPPKPTRALLHVEVFTGTAIESFIVKSRDRAKKLPDSGKTLLVIQTGTKLVKCPDPQSNTQLAGLTLVLAKGDPGKGCWAKVQPTRVTSKSASRGQGRSSHVSKTPVGDPLWVERQYAGKVAGAVVNSWSDFPLRIANAQGPAVGYQQVLSRAQLDQSPESGKATDDQGSGGTQWWSVAAGNADGTTIVGWLCEKDHPDTQWQSPWAWPGFDTVDTTSVPLLDMYRRNLFEARQLLDGEDEEFSVVAATVNAGALIGKLEKAAKRQRDNKDTVTPADLKNALTVPWLAQAISHLIVRYESEWGGEMSKWDGLSRLMGKGKYIWQAELERIGRLRWWEGVKVVKGFPVDASVWHIHPIGLVGNFAGANSSTLTIEEARVRAFLRMIRVGEGTERPIGYERLFGGQSFIKDFSRDFSDHPRILVTRTNSKGKTLRSTAAGAYQVMGYTWDDSAYVAYRAQHRISDFTPISQDRYCVILLKYKRHALEDVKKGEIQRAVSTDGCNLEWASLPGNSYGQGGVDMSTVNDKFREYLNDELNGKTDLAVPIGGLDDLIK